MKILNDISYKERFAKSISFFSIATIGVVMLCAFFMYSNRINSTTEKAKGEVFMLVDGYMVKAIRNPDYQSNIEASTKGTIMLFHQYFWNLEPYADYINQNHNRAFDYADNSVKRLRAHLNEEEFYNGILSGKYSCNFVGNPSDIQIDLSQKPYKFTVKAKLKIFRQDDIVYHNLITSGFLEQRKNSENNFTGFMIKDYKVLDFSIISNEEIEKDSVKINSNIQPTDNEIK